MPRPENFEVTHCLDRIRRNAGLQANEIRLLSHLVDQTLRGDESKLSQKTIAADVFGRDLRNFDPRADSIVRTTAANLRNKLLAWYAGSGCDEPVIIELPKGTYVPRFERREKLSPQAAGSLWSARVAMEARTVSGYATAIKHLDRVLLESPELPLGLALKAEALASRAIHGERPRPNLEQARDLALRAVDRPAPVWQAWLAWAIVQQALDLKWAEAGEAYDKALELSKGESATHVWYTAFLVGRGRAREAVARLRDSAEQFGYSNPTCIGDLCMLLMLARDYDAASHAIAAALEAAPGYYQHHLNHAILLEALGQPQAASRVLDQAPLKIWEKPVTWGLKALFSGLSGNKPLAHRRLTWLKTAARTGQYVPPSQFAACWLGVGESDRAVQHLEQAAEERDPLAVWFHAYPFFRHLHGHSGFRRLIDQIGLVWQ